MNGYLPAFLGFLGALLIAVVGYGPDRGAAPVLRALVHLAGMVLLAFAVTIYGLALAGVAVFA